MNKLQKLGIFIALVAIFIISAIDANAKLSVSSMAVDADTGEILSSKNPDAIQRPASLTKMMTLYITFEALEKGIIKLDDELLVSHNAANRAPSKLGMPAGSKIKVKTAIDALVVKSANDCATVLAEALGHSEEKFAQHMTKVAKTLGMKKTVFRNASGLPHKTQVTTARDMITLGAALYHHFPQYYHLFSKKSFSYQGKTYTTHNHLLKNFAGADGMKTGYTAASGYNIVTSAKRENKRVIAVTLGHKNLKERDKNVAQIMDKGLKKLALNSSSKPSKLYAKLEKPQEITLEKIRNTEKTKQEAKLAKIASQNWAIQIGAFSNYAKARNYAISVKKDMPELRGKKIDVEPAETAYTIVYRSKIINFSKNAADEVCNNLKKANKSCIVVAMNKDSQLTMASK